MAPVTIPGDTVVLQRDWRADWTQHDEQPICTHNTKHFTTGGDATTAGGQVKEKEIKFLHRGDNELARVFGRGTSSEETPFRTTDELGRSNPTKRFIYSTDLSALDGSDGTGRGAGTVSDVEKSQGRDGLFSSLLNSVWGDSPAQGREESST